MQGRCVETMDSGRRISSQKSFSAALTSAGSFNSLLSCTSSWTGLPWCGWLKLARRKFLSVLMTYTRRPLSRWKEMKQVGATRDFKCYQMDSASRPARRKRFKLSLPTHGSRRRNRVPCQTTRSARPARGGGDGDVSLNCRSAKQKGDVLLRRVGWVHRWSR